MNKFQTLYYERGFEALTPLQKRTGGRSVIEKKANKIFELEFGKGTPIRAFPFPRTENRTRMARVKSKERYKIKKAESSLREFSKKRFGFAPPRSQSRNRKSAYQLYREAKEKKLGLGPLFRKSKRSKSITNRK